MEQIRDAFKLDQSIIDRIQGAIARHQDPDLAFLFADIVSYIQRIQSTSSQPTAQLPLQNGSKKRKLESNGTSDQKPVFTCKDVSFSIPARKKLKLELASSGADGTIRLVDQKTEAVEFALDRNAVDQVFCLPVPEKATRQQNFVVLPKDDSEPFVFTINEAPDKQNTISLRSGQSEEGELLHTVFAQELEAFGLSVQKPDANEFASSISEPHRKGEKSYHVKAFRGSKDGYLFFLATGILFGFKKPLTFFPFDSIESISYTSVLQRTFNLVITQHGDESIEFSMLDQADFAGIDAYIKAHGLNDASMAAERRAKMYNVNKPKEKDGEANEAQQEPVDGQTELQRAEQQLQDEEDELEEDYDPSGGESDGEGAESEEEEEPQGAEEPEADDTDMRDDS